MSAGTSQLDELLKALAGTPFGSMAESYFTSTAATSFFSTIRDYVLNQFEHYAFVSMGNVFQMCSILGMTLLTMQVLWRGYELSTGQARGVQETVVKLMKSGVIMAFVTSWSFFGQNFYNLVLSFQDWIVYTMSSQDGTDNAYRVIDKSLSRMQGLLALVNGLDTAGNSKAESSQSWSLILTTGGVAGPAIVAGSLLILNQIAILLFCAFAPLFIMALMFENTKSLFWQWLKYGFSTMFALAILTLTSVIMGDTLLKFSEGALVATLLKYLIGGNSASLSSMAMQQGGLGAIMTIFLITVPNLVGQFFGGTLGNFTGYNNFTGYLSNDKPQAGASPNNNYSAGANSTQVQQHGGNEANNRVNRTETAPLSLGHSYGLNASNQESKFDQIKLKSGTKNNGDSLAA